ncbi:hypothetical protein [Actinomadura sp. DC4]|uniref:hypothetical protein n=1 Tax=Actinomadura sp. DC4 TaxID=3055069 RepID=UPI0025AFA9C2|nr:hypothetical protein [Actinomadura sp. DC4]MDN3356066.1 hypothetical protein [Actinomadura sp. DC4]
MEPKPSLHGPVCPVCETLVGFEPVNVDVRAGFVITEPGPWFCPNGCDPRQAEAHETAQQRVAEQP